MAKNKTIRVKEMNASLFIRNSEEYISLIDLARYKNPHEPKELVKNWIMNRGTLEFLGVWEKLNNPSFNKIKFDVLLYESGSHSFALTPIRWTEITNAIGIFSRGGAGGGTFAHPDIAIEFACWLSPAFRLCLLQECQRQQGESNQALQNLLCKIDSEVLANEHFIPVQLTQAQTSLSYATEDDVLNVALFGKTNAGWQVDQSDANENIRDAASVEQLLVLANLEYINAILLQQNLRQEDRLWKLNEIAISQMKSLLGKIKHP